MPLSSLQRRALMLLAASRSPESYVAGASVINLAGPRTSQDIDIFHDREESVAASALADGATLSAAGLTVDWTRLEPAIHAAQIGDGTESTRLEWVRDSDFRFFPAIPDEVFGYRLHIADIAMNKALAAAGRRVPRDVVDLLTIEDRGLSLSAILWAAVGKDPGFTPESLALEISRHSIYQQSDYDRLELEAPVDAGDISRRIKASVRAAIAFAQSMPPTMAGLLFLKENRVVVPDPNDLGSFQTHAGQRKGHWPSSSEIGSAMVTEC